MDNKKKAIIKELEIKITKKFGVAFLIL